MVLAYRTVLMQKVKEITEPGTKILDSFLLLLFAVFVSLKENEENKDLAQKRDALLRHGNQELQSTCIKIGQTSAKKLEEVSPLFNKNLKFFLRFGVPDLVCSVEQTLQVFDSLKADISCIVHHIIKIKLVAYRIQNTKSEEELVPWVVYLEEEKDVRLTKEQFEKLYQSINYYRLPVGEYSVKKDAVLATEIWTKLNEPDVNQLEYAVRMYTENANTNDLLKKSKEYRYLKNEPVAGGIEYDKQFSQAVRHVAKVWPIDFLFAVDVDRNCNDISIENGILFQKFVSLLNPCEEEAVLLINPPPFFFRKWMQDEDLNHVNTTVVCDQYLVAMLLKHQVELEKRDHIFVNHSYTWQKYVDASRSINHHKVLMFTQGMKGYRIEEYWRYFKNFAVKPTLISQISATNEFENAASPLHQELLDEMVSITAIDLIPQGVLNCTYPRRKLLIHAQIEGQGKANRTTQLQYYALNTQWDRQLLCRHFNSDVVVPTEQIPLNNSIRELYRKEIQKRLSTGAKRSMPISYAFTPELTIWCSRSFPKYNEKRPRLEAYVSLPQKEMRIDRKILERGNRIEQTIKRTTKIELHQMEHWLEHQYPFTEVQERRNFSSLDEAEPENTRLEMKQRRSIREEIIATYGAIYDKKHISVKLLWYFYPELKDRYSESDYQTLENLVRTEVGMLNVGAADLDDYREAIALAFPTITQRMQNLYTMLLSQALDFAVLKRHCDKNVLKQELAELAETKRDFFSEIREALVKRTFSQIEVKKVYAFVMEQIAQRKCEYLGVLIRLSTGLESNVVCALTWKDFHYVEDYGYYQIWVHRQVTNDGLEFRGFSRKEDYRRVPCSPLLARELLNQKQWMESEISNLTKSQIQNLPIITTMEILEHSEQQYQMYRPIDLEKISRLAIQAAEIEDHVIWVPDSKQGTKETNLAHYQGDVFRSNFRFYAKQYAKFEDGELMYLLGNKPKTTFERHYCDYLNDAIQYGIWVKLCRLESWMIQPGMRPFLDMNELFISNRYTIEVQANGMCPPSAQIDIWLKENDCARITLKSLYGINATATRLHSES